MFDTNTYLETLVRDSRAVPYIVHLLFDEAPTLDKADLLDALRTQCGNVEPVDPKSEQLVFAFPDHKSLFQEGPVPAQFVIAPEEGPLNIMELLGASLIQTWDWPDAADGALRAKGVVAVSDAFAGGLRRIDRLGLFHGVIKALIQLVPPTAIHWIPSQRIVNPAAYIVSLESEGIVSTAALNVRFFNVEGNQGEKVMDTMGMAAFGLSDLQCHFAGIDPPQVAALLFHYGEYLFQKGEVIRDGNTIQGIEPSDRWPCRHMDAIVPPTRIVIDIVPGKHAPK